MPIFRNSSKRAVELLHKTLSLHRYTTYSIIVIIGVAWIFYWGYPFLVYITDPL